MTTWSLEIDIKNVDKIQNLDLWLEKLISDEQSLNGAYAEATNVIARTSASYLQYGNVMREVVSLTDKEINTLVRARIYYEDMNKAMNNRLTIAYELARAEEDLKSSGSILIDMNEDNIVAEQVLSSVRDDNLKIIEDQMTSLENFNEAQRLRHEGAWEEVADLYLLEEQIAENTRLRKEEEKAIRDQTKELTNQSISLFVANIVFTQWATLGKQLSGDNKALAKTFEQMKYSIQLVILPFQTYTAIAYLAEQQSISTGRAAASLGLAFLSVFLILYAFQTKSPAIRAAILGLASAVAVLSMWNWLAAKGALAKGAAEAGAATWWGGGFGSAIFIAAVVGAIAAGIGAISAMQQAQTLPDTLREVTETGPIIAHRGEILGRVSSQTTNNIGSTNSVVININGNADSSTVDQLRNALIEVLASGQYKGTSNARSSML